jgi:hypothetical protein
VDAIKGSGYFSCTLNLTKYWTAILKILQGVDLPKYFIRSPFTISNEAGFSKVHRASECSQHPCGAAHFYELDSGKSKGFQSSHQTVRKFDYDEISNILHDLAIVIPIKNEKLKLLEGVLSGVPNECLIIIVSNSSRGPWTGLQWRQRQSGSLAGS